MFKILLVDDEPMIKIGVRKLLEGTEYVVAGTASNGVDALNFLESNTADIVLTDLKMPIMDGIELICQLRAVKFEGAILALSNYSDFELVRKALTEGASDYILKTDMTKSHLLEHLSKISQDICSRRIDRVKETQSAHQQQQDRRKLLFAEIERSLFTDSPLSTDAQSLLAAGQRQPVRHGIILIDMTRAQEHQSRSLLRQIHAILPDVFSGACPVQTIPMQQNQLLCLLLDLPNRECLLSFSRRILRQAEVYFKAVPSISAGSCSGSIQSLRACFKTCQDALRYAFYYPNVSLFPIEKYQAFRQDDEPLYHDLIQKMIAASRADTAEPAITGLRGFLSVCKQELYDPDWVRSCCSRGVEQLLLSPHYSVEKEAILALTRKFWTAPDVQNLQTALSEALLGVSFADPLLRASNKPEVAAALAYIDGHYAEKITLEILAEHVQLNKSYLCRLFKQETGLNIFGYINQVRMKNAARILSDQSAPRSVGTVASAVGVDDAFYFARKFKDFYGKTPREYMREAATDAP